ncbi:hypothetical protein SOP87_30295, partial [Bacillus cereus]|uniref:hypothetical protein n=1 Tax=Bacillus cereus TaxID=1396 RepID=UPI002B24EF34
LFPYLDTSEHTIIQPHNKKVPGKLKDETLGDVIVKFAGLSAKVYSFKTCSAVVKKAKGIGKVAVEKELVFEDYKNCIKSQNLIKTSESRIQSVDHLLTTNIVRKVALAPHYDKRCILSCCIHTLPWGHCDLKNGKQCPITEHDLK